MPSLQIFFHVKVKKVRFTWKTIPRMGPTNSIPDSKQIGLQKNRAQRHGFSLGRSVEARTPGLCVPNAARYQLRYTPICPARRRKLQQLTATYIISQSTKNGSVFCKFLCFFVSAWPDLTGV